MKYIPFLILIILNQVCRSQTEQILINMKISSYEHKQFDPLYFEVELCNSSETLIGVNTLFFEVKKISDDNWEQVAQLGKQITEGHSIVETLEANDCMTKEVILIPAFYKKIYFDEPGQYAIRYSIISEEHLVISSEPLIISIEAYEGVDKEAFEWLKESREPIAIYSTIIFGSDEWIASAFFNRSYKDDFVFLIENFPNSIFQEWANLNLILLPSEREKIMGTTKVLTNDDLLKTKENLSSFIRTKVFQKRNSNNQFLKISKEIQQFIEEYKN